MLLAMPICFMLERQVAWRAFSRAWAKTGNRIAARMAMMAMTTRSSIRVNPNRCTRFIDGLLLARGSGALSQPITTGQTHKSRNQLRSDTARKQFATERETPAEAVVLKGPFESPKRTR